MTREARGMSSATFSRSMFRSFKAKAVSVATKAMAAAAAAPKLIARKRVRERVPWRWRSSTSSSGMSRLEPRSGMVGAGMSQRKGARPVTRWILPRSPSSIQSTMLSRRPSTP